MVKTLANLLTREINAGLPLTSCGITWGDFLSDIKSAISFLNKNSSINQNVAIYSADTYFFITFLLASWQLGRHVVIPGECTEKIEQELSDCCLIGSFSKSILSSMPFDDSIYNYNFRDLDNAFVAITVYTSGSTGQPDKVLKTISQLDSEIAALQANFGYQITPEKTEVHASVTHQHFYGLPFRLLWPLCSGAKISRGVVNFPEQWLSIDQENIFITTPAFLKRISSFIPLKNISENVKGIFSAGGVLDFDVWKSINSQLPLSNFVEIYGSSETGSVAWRSRPDEEWILQPDVSVDINSDGLLKIKSKFLSTKDWFQTKDLAVLSGCSFELNGRVDRIVKIEEKRISLTSVENTLSELDSIDAAKSIVLNKNNRDFIGVVVKLTASGLADLISLGRLVFIERLKTSVSDSLEPLAMPRVWRFVCDFPVNQMGKTTNSDLNGLFFENLKKPLVVNKFATDLSCDFLLDLSKGLDCLRGHFPDKPIVPGVAQIQWALDYAIENGFVLGEFKGMDVIKFQNPISPPQLINLTISWDCSRTRLTFKYFDADVTYSSGKLNFHE